MTKANTAIQLLKEKGYRCDTRGNVRNPRGQIVKGYINADGYITLKTRIPGAKQPVPVPLHRFAAYCYFGLSVLQKGSIVRHLNGKKTDNRKSNLRVGNASDNSMDRPKHQRVEQAKRARAKMEPKRQFSPSQVVEIRRMYEDGNSYRKIADFVLEQWGVKVSHTSVSRIVKKETYTDVL